MYMCAVSTDREGEGEIQQEYFLRKLSILIAAVSLRGWQATRAVFWLIYEIEISQVLIIV